MISIARAGVEESGVQVTDTGIHTEGEGVSTSYSIELENFFTALDHGRWTEEQKLKRMRAKIGVRSGLLFDKGTATGSLDANLPYDQYMELLSKVAEKMKRDDASRVWRF